MSLNKQVLFCIFLLLITDIFAKRERIIGGTKGLIRDYAHLVSFRSHANVHFCAGSIISQSFVLSAAHCFIAYKHEFYKIKVVAGTTRLSDTTGSVYEIERIVNHPLFTWTLNESESPNDICVIKLKTEITFNAYQNKIDLPTRDVFNENIAIVAGWGSSSSANKRNSDVLLKAPMTLYDYITCSERIPFKVFEDQFCAFNSIGVGTCDGDSGGSVTSNGELYGIISISYKCADGLPDVHTKVYSHLHFIKSVLPNN